MQPFIRTGVQAALALVTLAGCTDRPTPTELAKPLSPTVIASLSGSGSEHGRHIIMFARRQAPDDFATRVTARGGTVEQILTGPGLAIVSGLTPEAAADLSATEGIDAVGADRVMAPDPADEAPPIGLSLGVSSADSEDDSSEPLLGGSTDASSAGRVRPDLATYYPYQWNMRAIKANAAWYAGYLGSPEVKVFLLDTGIDYTRADLEGRVDMSRSVSLVPRGSAPDEYALAAQKNVRPFMDFHSHGTAVASTIVSNGVDLAGVSAHTTIVAVKVLNRTRVGLVSTFIQGIRHAADNDADIIHLSLPFTFPRAGNNTTIALVDAATTYAHEKGAVIVAAAGNNAADLDGDLWRFCNARFVICVSATGPTRAISPTLQLHVDEPATYTNFGVNTIAVAGPGGTDAPNLRVLVNCSRFSEVTVGNPAPCRTGAPNFETVGTTFGAAATSGLAALIVSQVGRGDPDRIRMILTQSANDLGPRGPDTFYGEGRINVIRAMALTRPRDETP